MKTSKARVFLFISVITFVSGLTLALKAQNKQKEKQYTVALPLQGWIQLTQQLEVVKNQLRQSDIPSKNVVYMTDSLLTPIQTLIGQQVNGQLEAEKQKTEVKKDTTKPKKQ